ncbi:MAG: hypothetical protein L3J39_08135 [Verrucomicrobiales bacterium]|nr:hypothetical protein [Verrucomicrobiales bacterium]
MRTYPLLLWIVSCLAAMLSFAGSAIAVDTVKIATFNVDATPPIGSPVAYAPARSIVDPLSARGVVILAGDQKPVVLCAVDWIGIGNGGQDVWKEKLAAAAGTTPDRVAVHVLHQHDGCRCDFSAEALLQPHGLENIRMDQKFAMEVIARVSAAIVQAKSKARVVTHVGIGKAKVEKVASNRRIMSADGKKVEMVRYTACRDPKAIAAPEGTIDPFVQVLSFWNKDQAVVSISYYATHPQSHYGKGDVSCDFPGIARRMREEAVPGVAHIHFDGAGGNIGAGKYNDGSPERRPILAARLAKGMKLAWQATEKYPLIAADVNWATVPVALPPAKHLDEQKMLQVLNDDKAKQKDRLAVVGSLSWLQRCKAGYQVPIGRLRLGEIDVLHMPGELFVEYQLNAQKLRPGHAVLMAAYGDYGPGYIGTEVAYGEGGYETSERASDVAPEVEGVLMDGVKKLLAR